MRKTMVCSIVLLLLTGNASSTLLFPNLLYNRTFQKRMNIYFMSLIGLENEGFLLGGKDNYSEYIIKTDRLGRMLWEYAPRDYSYPNFNTATMTTHNGNYLLAGTAKIRTDSTYNTWYEVIRLSALNVAGTLEWEKIYRDTMYNIPVAMAEMDDSGILIAGNALPRQSNQSICMFIKTDANGNMLWQKYYPIKTENVEVCALQKTSDGNYLVLAYKKTENVSWLLKISPSGDTLSTKTFYYKSGNKLFSMQPTADGNFICAGTFTNLNGNKDFWVVKIDQSGNYLWFKGYDRSTADIAKAIDTVTGGGYCFAGSSGNNCVLMKINENGDSLWTFAYESNISINPSGIVCSADGRFTIAGTMGINPNGIRETQGGFLMILESESKSKQHPEFDNWEVLNTENSTLPANYISKTAVDSTNRIWLAVRSPGYSSAKIVYQDNQGWKILDDIPEQQIFKLTVSKTGEIWVSGDRGIYRYDGTFVEYFKTPGQAYGVVPVDYFTAYVCDNNGVSLLRNGILTRLNGFTDTLAIKTVYDVTLDRDSNIWFVPFYGVSVKKDTIMTHYTAANTGLREFRAKKVYIDRNNALWVSTERGLLTYANGVWNKFDSTNTPLTSSDISAFTIDTAGVAYAACSKGFCSVRDKTLYSYDNSPLPSNEIHSMTIDKSGTMWIGTSGGLVCIHPSTTGTSAKSDFKKHSLPRNTPASHLLLQPGTASSGFTDCNRFRYFDLMGRPYQSIGNLQKQKGNISNGVIIRKGR